MGHAFTVLTWTAAARLADLGVYWAQAGKRGFRMVITEDAPARSWPAWRGQPP
jgi:hypothetical protein